MIGGSCVQEGRAHFEMGRYVEAEKCFKWARAVSPHRVEDMDVYSTTLFVTNPKPETQNPNAGMDLLAHGGF